MRHNQKSIIFARRLFMSRVPATVWISSAAPHDDDDDEMVVGSNNSRQSTTAQSLVGSSQRHVDPLMTATPAPGTKKRGVVSRAQYTSTTWYSGDVIQLNGASGFVPDGEGTLSFWIEGSSCAPASPPPSLLTSPLASSSPTKALHPGSPTRRSCELPQQEDDKFLVRYRGSFCDGKRHGTGTIINEKGSQLTCKWEHDVPEVGKDICCLTTEEGDEYVGMVSIISDGSLTSRDAFRGLEWVRSVRFVPDATGEMWIRSERKRYCGEWQCGQRHGFGVETDVGNLYCFSGGYQYDSREGSGTLFQSAQRTVLSGLWKDGSLHGSAALHLPNQAALIQSHSWTSIERSYEFDAATILRSRVVDGIWEPLFVTFDSTLALSVAEVASTSAFGGASRPSSPQQQPPAQSPRTTAVLSRLEQILEKDDFLALLSTFQRCFYFIYGSCHRFLDNYEFTKKLQTPTRPTSAPTFPESWCCLVGLDASSCLHRTSRERTYTPAHLKQAVEYVASFVFSIRLRLLSYLAALPTACDLDVGRRIASMCWDVAFSAVEPLLLHIAETLCKDSHAAFRCSAQRCKSLSNVEDFIGLFDLWFPASPPTTIPLSNRNPTEESSLGATPQQTSDFPDGENGPPVSDELDNTARTPQSLNECPLSASSALVDDDNPRQSFDAHLQVALDAFQRCGLERSAHATPIRRHTPVQIRHTLTGILFTVDGSRTVRPSALINDVNVIFSSIRSAAKAASRPTQKSSALGYLQDQLLLYTIFEATNRNEASIAGVKYHRNIEGLLSLVCLMLSDSIDPPLPGASVQKSRRRHAFAAGADDDLDGGGSPTLLTQNDSMDGHRMLSGSDATDEERQASFQSTFQILSLVQSLQRACSTWPGLRIPRWGCVVALDDLLLRVEHGIVVAFVNGNNAVLMSSDGSSGGARVSRMSQFYEDIGDDTTTALQTHSHVLPLRSCRELMEELQNAPVFGDLSGGASTAEFVIWMVDAVSSLVRKLISSPATATNTLPIDSNDNTGTSPTTSPPSPTAHQTPLPVVFSAKKHIKQLQIRGSVWYSDIIPRYVVLLNLVSLFGLRLKLEFTSGTGATGSPVAPDEAYYAVLKLDAIAVPTDAALVTYVLSCAVDRWETAVIQAIPPQQWRKKVR